MLDPIQMLDWAVPMVDLRRIKSLELQEIQILAILPILCLEGLASFMRQL